jgi:hypothetical protein
MEQRRSFKVRFYPLRRMPLERTIPQYLYIVQVVIR